MSNYTISKAVLPNKGAQLLDSSSVTTYLNSTSDAWRDVASAINSTAGTYVVTLQDVGGSTPTATFSYGIKMLNSGCYGTDMYGQTCAYEGNSQNDSKGILKVFGKINQQASINGVYTITVS